MGGFAWILNLILIKLIIYYESNHLSKEVIVLLNNILLKRITGDKQCMFLVENMENTEEPNNMF